MDAIVNRSINEIYTDVMLMVHAALADVGNSPFFGTDKNLKQVLL